MAISVAEHVRHSGRPGEEHLANTSGNTFFGPGDERGGMQTVTVSRSFDAPADALVEHVQDLEPFMLAAGFDEVDVAGDEVRIANAVGLLTIELDLRVVDEPEYALVYEQTDGIFAEMVTRYAIEGAAGGRTVTATTDFELDASLVGPILDATVIKRQRRKELTSQFEYLASVTEGGRADGSSEA